MEVLWHPSPNHGPRRGGILPDLVVIHYTAMRSAEAALARLCDPAAEVSSHYLIGVDGTVWGLVPEDLRAWHAGAGSWQGVEDVNSRSIGIELDNDGRSPFGEPLMSALCALLPGIMERHGIWPEGVIGHSCAAPGRKVDPGRRFDWRRLERMGLASGGAPGGEAGDFAGDMAAAGFTGSADPGALLTSLRLRYRPGARGPLSEADRRLAGALAERFGVDRGARGA